MQIINISINELVPYENNPRFNDDAVEYVANSIKEFGFRQPIVIDSNNVVVAGHTRLKAAARLNLEEVPCVVADDLSEEQIRAYRLADNKTAEIAEWDMEALEAELEAIMDIDMSGFGFSAEDLDIFGEAEEDDFDVDENLPKEPQSEPGAIYQLGNHRLMCGDSTKAEDIMKLTEGKMMDMYLTDPPYNVAYEGKTADRLTIENDNMEDAMFQKFLSNAFRNVKEVLAPGGAFYIFHAASETYNFYSACRAAGLQIRQQLIWAKNQFVLGRQDYHWQHEPILYGWNEGAPHHWHGDRAKTTLLEFDRPLKNAEHPTMKPVELLSTLICNSSKKGDFILDSFGGSGSTLIACEQLGRACYVMELDPRYIDVIIMRWEKLTGKKAAKIS